MPPELAQWLAQPFSPDMSATRWALFIAFLLVLLWGWRQVYREFVVIEAEV